MLQQGPPDQIYSQKIILPKIDRSAKGSEGKKEFNEADREFVQKRGRERRNSTHNRTMDAFKIRKQFLSQKKKNQKFKKRRQMILRQKQLQDEKMMGKFGDKIFYEYGHAGRINSKWRCDKDVIERWKAGMTGMPIIDAIMRDLLKTGYISNRAR